MNTNEKDICPNCGCEDLCFEDRCLNSPTDYYTEVCVEFED